MMRKLLFMLCLLLMLGVQTRAQEIRTYTFGGSERDWLYQIAVSDRGEIALTGWTESSDGSLKNRTKKGRSGWLLVIDGEGNEIVNFCTRLGNHDHLADPVFHEDGTLTMLLFAEDANVGWMKYELIRMDMNGEVLSRRVIAQKDEKAEHYISAVGHDARGYILREVSYRGEGYCHYELYDFDGNHVRRLEGRHHLNALADAHAIHADQEDGKKMYLYRSDGQVGETKLSWVFDLREDQLRPVMYDGFISLPDGGAVGAGWMLDKDEANEERIGLFTRWNAQGGLVSEVLTPGWGYGEITLHPGGFAATAYPWDETWANDSVWMLYLLDEYGMMEGMVPLTSDAVGTGHNACIGALEDGTVVTAHVVPENGQDSVVTIIRP